MSEGSVNWCERLYEAQATQLLLYGRALGLSHSEAEDVLQDTFIALMRMETEPEKPVNYCVRAFRNRALNYRRSLWRRLARELESKAWFDRAPQEASAERSAMRCLMALPAEQREVIVLKIWQQLTFEAIGEMLNISPNTVAGRYRYGMQKIRACLRTESPESESYEHVEPNRDAIAFLDPAPTLGTN
ncbi:MAG TPA: sigma-70 family RNA polymerase sigma factor [Verrucomicrobiae bacterium]|nr:sigma-70 family RNA polymerase sigma factor [Verrucomicrobiae bacterium]